MSNLRPGVASTTGRCGCQPRTGIIASVRGRPTAVMVFYVRNALITAVYAIADPDKLARLVRQ
jgi:hypothetical protein